MSKKRQRQFQNIPHFQRDSRPGEVKTISFLDKYDKIFWACAKTTRHRRLPEDKAFFPRIRRAKIITT
jgi:hypothetical protein